MHTLPPRSLRSGAVLLWALLALLGGIGSYAAGQQRSRVAPGAGPRGDAGPGRVANTQRRDPRALLPHAIDPSGFAWVRTVDGPANGTDVAQAVAFGKNGTVVAAGRLSANPEGATFTVAKYSSAGTLLWTRSLGDGNSFSEARDVAVDSADGVIAVGTLNGAFAVAKWDKDGNLVRVFPSPQAQTVEFGTARSVALDKNDNIFVGGDVLTGGSFSNDVFTVMGFESDGSRIWEQPIGFSGQANSVAVDANNDVIAGGTASFDSPQFFYVVKLANANGAFRWSQTVNGSGGGFNEALSVAVDPQNNVLAAGYVDNDSRDFTVTKLTGDTGDFVWLQELDSPSNSFDVAYDVASDSAGNAIAVGDIRDVDGFDQFAVQKLAAADGSLVWLHYVQGNGNLTREDDNVARAVAVDAQDNVIVGGWLQNTNGHDFTVTKLTSAGNTVWQRSLNGSANGTDEAYDVAVDPNLNVAAAGLTENTGTFQDFTVAYSDEQPPTLTNCSVTPTAFPASGGTSNLQVTVTDNFDIRNVYARIQRPDGSTVDVPLTPVPTLRFQPRTPNGNYTGSFQFPANTTGAQQVYPVSFFAVDMSSNQSPLVPCGAVTVNADSNAPVIVGCSINPPSVGPAGAPVTISATITDNQSGAQAVAEITNPDNSVTSLPLTPQGGGGSPGGGTNDTFTGVFNVPANLTGQARAFPVTIRATDSANNQTTQPCTPIAQAGDTQPPALSNPQASPTQLPQGGGNSILSVNVTDDQGVGTVIAVVTSEGGTQVTVPLQRNTTGDLTQFTGTFQAPAGPAGTPAVFTTRFTATDTSNNSASINGPSITVGTDTQAPSITNIQVAPRNLGPEGGTVTVSADVTDNVGVGSVTATLTPPTGTPITVTLQQVTAQRKPRVAGDGTYRGTLNVPANTTFDPLTYTVSVTATDTSGNVATAAGGSVTVGANGVPAPTVTNFTVTPRNQPSTGGTVTLTVDATDPTGISSVVATVTRPGGQSPLSVTLNRQGGSNTFTGSFNTSPNLTQTPQQYSLSIAATNTRNNTTTLDAGLVTVAVPAAITLQNCTATPTSLTGAGGNVQVTVDVIAPAGVQRVFVTANPNTKIPNVVMDLSPAGPGSGGVVPYAGTVAIPPNTLSTSITYTLTITGIDVAGNSTTVQCGTVTQSVGGGGTIRVTPSSVNFGNVRVGWGLRKKVTIQNTGTGTLSGTLTRPFGVFTIVNVEQTGKGAKRPHGGVPSVAFSLETGQKLVVTVQFAPVSHKPSQETLLVTSSDARNGTKTVKLRGTGCGKPAHGS